jgi:hypothetical protein
MIKKYLSSKVPSARELHLKFINSTPFPHVVIDDFLEPELYEKILIESKRFHEMSKNRGRTYSTSVESEKWTSQGLKLNPTLIDVGKFFGSNDFLNFLQEITEIKKLISITDFNSDSIGFFAVMKKNSYLGPHIDHMYDMTGNSGYHILNIIFYISNSWDPNWGGSTFLRNRSTGEYCSVEYKPNRALIFLHTPQSEHGTSRISSIASEDRMSIYFDFYSPDKSCLDHLGLNVKLTKSPHLFFLPNFIDYFSPKNYSYLKFQLKHILESFKILFRK